MIAEVLTAQTCFQHVILLHLDFLRIAGEGGAFSEQGVHDKAFGGHRDPLCRYYYAVHKPNLLVLDDNAARRISGFVPQNILLHPGDVIGRLAFGRDNP